MSDLSQLPSDTDNEGEPPGWRHWWDRVAKPSSGDDSPSPLDSAEEWEAVEEEEEATTVAARAKAEARAKAKAKMQPASTVDD
jgi:hypothetical protein